MNAAPALVISDVHVTFRKRELFKSKIEIPILRGISLSVNKGQALGVIGSNGAGKSTLLRLMAGILEPDSGVITNNGLTTSLLTLTGGIFPECSGRDNVIMLLMLQQNISYADARALVPTIAAFAELESVIDAPMHTYSSGMLSRLKFAVALKANPDILLVDEVLAVGDPPFSSKSLAAMRETLSSGVTVVFVSHSLYDVYTYCTQAVWIDKGRVAASGGAKEVVQLYREFCIAQGADVVNPAGWAEFVETKNQSKL